MRADREWMYNRHLEGHRYTNPEFIAGVISFVDYACQQLGYMDVDKIRCPCLICQNRNFHLPETVKLHLMKKGFKKDYHQWVCHGEPLVGSSSAPSHSSTSPVRDEQGSNSYRNMVIDATGGHDFNSNFNNNEDQTGHDFNSDSDNNEAEPPDPKTQRLYDLLREADEPLWAGCSELSQLSMIARLLNIKSESRMTEKTFDAILELFKDALPPENKLIGSFYETKKYAADLGLPCEKIDCCINGCMLYWGEDKERRACKFCNHPRYKQRKRGAKKRRTEIPHRFMHYFPLTPRLQRLYASKVTAKHMRWHAEHDQTDGVMSHPSDSKAWKDFDSTNPSFALETRNVKLGLCTDGFQPFGLSGQQYSCWPVIVTPYNLPPWMCMKDPYMFLTIIVPGPKNPKQRIDVFLQPLIHELLALWQGVQTYDASKEHNFLLRASLLWTISDFPAYGMLSGWSTSGKKACPYCLENSKAFSLTNGKKVSWFDSHRQFLSGNHAFRRNKNDFLKNRMELSPPPLILTGEEVMMQIDNFTLRKVTEIGGEEHNASLCKVCGWRKRSIFWDLPYWRTNLIRHNLDVMHIEKNVFENVFETVMDIEGKTKDNAKAREDIKIFCKRKELEKNESTGKYPKASYCLGKQEKKVVCEWVSKLQFPDGYVSNMSRCIDIKKYKLFGMKSHDCHVFMQRLLPIAFRELLPATIWKALTELSLFFRDLTCSMIKEEDMIRLHNNIPVILCKLERIFPPSLFDSMEHLPIHLAYEARVAGPVQYRWMYPFERFLGKLKLKVTNKAKVEGSIANAYLIEETSMFCSHYFEPHVSRKMNIRPRNDDGGDVEPCEGNISIFKSPGRLSGQGKSRRLTDEEYNAARIYVLLNCPEIEEYVGIFVEEIKAREPHLTDGQIDLRLENDFADWFDSYAHHSSNVDSQSIKDVALGPLRSVTCYPVYFVNGYKFHTKDHGSSRSTFNSGVCIKGSNYSDLTSDYYGILMEIVQLEYPALPLKRVVLFKCDWFDPTPNVGIKVHKEYNLVDVNSKKRFNKYEPFVLASQSLQVYYAPYPSLRRDKVDWWSVCKVKPRSNIELPTENMAFQDDEVETHSFDVVDQLTEPLNDPSGALIDIDDGHDDVHSGDDED